MADFDLSSPLAQAFITEGQGRGYSPMQIAAILGNSKQENNLQSGGNPGDGGISYGGMQWNKDRWANLQNFAQQQNTPWSDPGTQAKFYYNELDGPEKAYGSALKGAQTTQDANNAVISSLRPAGWSLNNPQGGDAYAKRLANTQAAFAALNGGGGNPQADSPSPGASQVSNPTGQSGFAVPQQPQSMWDKFKEGGPGALFGLPTTRVGGWDLGSALQGAGIAAMARDNPQGAAAMAQVPAMEARMMQPKFNMVPGSFNPVTGSYAQQNTRTGEVTPGNLQAKGYQPYQSLPEGEWDKFQNRNATINELNTNYDVVNKIRDDILNKNLDLSHLSEWKGDILAGLNSSDPNTRAQANWAHYQSLLAGANQRMQHGTQTDADLALAQNSVIPHGKENDNAAVLTSLENVQRSQLAHLNSLITPNQSDVAKFGSGRGNLGPGPWDDPSHYGNMLKSAQDYETNYAPRRDAFLKEWDGGRGTPGAPVNASTRPAGSTSSTGGSLLNNGQPIDPAKAPEYLKGMPSGTTFKGVDGKMYRIP